MFQSWISRIAQDKILHYAAVMFGWLRFRSRTFLDADDEAWQLEAWRWLLKHCGGLDDLRQMALVLPTAEFFPPTEAIDHDRAEHIFAAVKGHAGLTEWPCTLVAQERRPVVDVGNLAVVEPADGALPAGTFRVAGNDVVITYDPAALDEPMQLVATLAHELAHFLLATFSDEPPGGAEGHELATDLATVYLGFGLFGGNSAFNFQQYQGVLSQGWGWSRQGYLSQRQWMFALAVFLALREQPIEAARPFLKPHLFSDLRQAANNLRRRPEAIAALGDGAM